MNSIYRNLTWCAVGVFIMEVAHATSPPVSTFIEGGRQPQLASGPNNQLGMVYGTSNAIFCVSSENGGQVFSNPVEVAQVSGLMIGRRRGPRLAITENSWIVSAINREGSLMAWRSADMGKTWSKFVTVNDKPGAARGGLHALCASVGNEACLVWLDLRTKGMKIYGSRSVDGGKTWDANKLIYESPDKEVCTCCHPSLVSNRKGEIHVMWRNWLQGSRDMYVSTSKDGGITFGQAQKLGKGTWPLNGCPMDGGGIGIHPDGKLTTVWRRDKMIYQAGMDGDEKLLGEGSQPAIEVHSFGSCIAWQTPRGIQVLDPLAKSPLIFKNGAYPTIAMGSNPAGSLIVAWEEAEPQTGIRIIPLLTPIMRD
jgi:hypothetical protein